MKIEFQQNSKPIERVDSFQHGLVFINKYFDDMTEKPPRTFQAGTFLYGYDDCSPEAALEELRLKLRQALEDIDEILADDKDTSGTSRRGE